MSADRMILGKNAIYSMDSEETGLNNNVLVVGCSGCGKTRSLLEPSLLETKSSTLIVPVSKRRLVDQYSPSLISHGFNVHLMDFTNPSMSTCGWNPMEFIHTYTDIRALAESIVMANPRKETSHADSYWDDGSISLLTALIFLGRVMKKKPTFSDVLSLFDKLQLQETGDGFVTTLDEHFTKLEKENPTSYALVCWRSFRSTPYRTASCLYSALNVCITSLFTPEIRKMMEMKNVIDAKTLTAAKTVLFIISSPVNPALRYLINIFYAQVIRDLFEYAESLPDGKLPIPVRIEFDDFACGSKIVNFPEFISIFREKQISVVLLIQSESQLLSLYGPDSTTIVNNCDTYVYMGGMDIHTCKNISERLNLPLDEVMYMPIGQEYIFRRGERPVVTKRYDILSDTRYIAMMTEYERKKRGDALGKG